MTGVTETADCFLHGPYDPTLMRCPHPDHARHERVAQELEAEVRASVARHGDPLDQLAEAEWESLRLLSFHGAPWNADEWLADLTREDVTRITNLINELAASRRGVLERIRELEAIIEEVRAAGQALRACPFNWESSMEAADAADAWDELEKKSNSPFSGTER